MIKKIFSIFFPKLPLEMIGPLLQLTFEGNASPLESTAESVKLPTNLFKVFYLMIMNEEEWIQQDLYELSDQILTKKYATLFKALYSIYKCGPEDNLEELCEVLGMDHKFGFMMSVLIGCIKSDGRDARKFLTVNIKIMVKFLDPDQVHTKNQGLAKILNYFLSLSNIFRRSSLDIFNFIVDNWLEIDPENAHIFYEACIGRMDKIEIVLNKIGYKGDETIIIEF